MSTMIDLAKNLLYQRLESLFPDSPPLVYLGSDLWPDIFKTSNDRILVELTADEAVVISEALEVRQPRRECDGQLSLF